MKPATLRAKRIGEKFSVPKSKRSSVYVGAWWIGLVLEGRTRGDKVNFEVINDKRKEI